MPDIRVVVVDAPWPDHLPDRKDPDSGWQWGGALVGLILAIIIVICTPSLWDFWKIIIFVLFPYIGWCAAIFIGGGDYPKRDHSRLLCTLIGLIIAIITAVCVPSLWIFWKMLMFVLFPVIGNFLAENSFESMSQNVAGTVGCIIFLLVVGYLCRGCYELITDSLPSQTNKGYGND